MTDKTYQTFRNNQPGHGDDRKTFEVMTMTYPLGTLGLFSSILSNNPLLRKSSYEPQALAQLKYMWSICSFC